MAPSITGDHGAFALTRTQLPKRCFAEKIGPGAMLIPCAWARA